MKKKYLLVITFLVILGGIALCLWPRGEFVSGHTPFSREDIIRIFNDNEEKFDYSVAVLKKMNLKNVYIRVKRTTKEIYIYDSRTDNMRLYSEYMPPDDQFETYLINLLVREKLGDIYIYNNGHIVFGPNQPITYSEKGQRVDDGPEPIWGKLNGDWYYYIHIPI